MGDEAQNNSIVGSWVSGSYGWGPLAGEATYFNGTVATTGQTFTAVYTGGSVGVNALPGSVQGGGFTFNGPLGSFLGWSFGVSASAGVTANYSMSADGYSLVMYGAGSNLEVGGTIGYTHLVDPSGSHSSSSSTDNSTPSSRDIVAGKLVDAFTGQIVYADAIIRGVAAAKQKREREIAEAAAWQREHNRDRQDGGSSSSSSGSSNNIATSSAATTNGTGYIQGGSNYSTSTFGTGNATYTPTHDNHADKLGFPIVIDLDGDGVEISPLGGSTARFDYDNDGFKELTAWVGKDDGLLVYDIGNDGQITQTREVVIADWTADTTDTDLDALKTAFDSNNDGLLNEGDTGWANFKIWNDTDQDGKIYSNRRVRAITPTTANVPIAAHIPANPLDRPLILPRHI